LSALKNESSRKARQLWNNPDTVKATITTENLSSLVPGESATILAIQTDDALRQRLMALGFRVGKRIELIRKASFSGPLQVRIGTTDILLRKSEAAKISVEKL
jgi:ferrous iron transport protein A